MLDLEKLAQIVASRMGPLLVEHQRCTRIRSPLSQCSRCGEICPRDAIAFTKEGIVFQDNCMECGLCAGVCPTGALGIQEPTELNLLEKIDKIGRHGGTVVLTCRRNSEAAPKVFTVPCLGSLSVEFLAAIDVFPFPVQVLYSERTCANCAVTGGGALYAEHLQRAGLLLENLALGGSAIKNVTGPPKILPPKKDRAGTDLGRRAFFRSIWGGARKAPWAALNNLLDVSEPEKPKLTEVTGITADRLRLLKELLAIVEDSKIQLQNLRHPYLQKTCHFCRACTVLCPVGALKYNLEEQRLLLVADRCVGCGLCIDVCFHRSLALEPAIVGSLKTKEAVILAQGIKSKCSQCGQEMVVSEPRGKCFVCEKKIELEGF